MRNSSKNIISKYWPTAVGIIVLPVLVYWFSASKTAVRDSSSLGFYPSVLEFTTQIEKRWSKGDIEGKWQKNEIECSDIPGNFTSTDPRFLECNPDYLRCFFQGKIKGLSAKFELGEFTFEVNEKSLKKFNSDHLLLRFKERKTNKEFVMKLQNHCGQKYLPENIYSHGADPKSLDIWDNYSRKIFIDDSYVTNLDILKWKQEKIKGEDSFLLSPSLRLSLKERRQYCFAQGKTLLQTHIFDALAFYPTNLQKNYMFKSRYPWSKTSNLQLKGVKSDCERMRTLECKNIPAKWMSALGQGWTGVSHTLGGMLEVFDNIFSKNNLKVSHEDLPAEHFWHHNAYRGHWTGKRFDLDHFNFKEEHTQIESDIEGVVGVAFRCMSYY